MCIVLRQFQRTLARIKEHEQLHVESRPKWFDTASIANGSSRLNSGKSIDRDGILTLGITRSNFQELIGGLVEGNGAPGSISTVESNQKL